VPVVEHAIFIPGVGGKAWLFEHAITHLADVASTEVMVLDSQSSREEMADWVLSHAPETFCLVGHSMGGWVAQQVAAQAPRRVSKLFLCDTWALKPDDTDDYLRGFWTHVERDLDGALNEHFGLLLHEDRYSDTEFCSRLKTFQRQMDADAYARQLKALAADYATVDLLPRITADTLVIHGRQDRIVTEEAVQYLTAGIANASLALIEDAGHCAPIEQPQAFTALLRLWLTRNE